MKQQQAGGGQLFKVEIVGSTGQHEVFGKGRAMVEMGEAFVGPGVGKEDFGTMVEAEVAPMVQLGAQDAAFIVHNAIYMAQMARPGRGLQRGGPPVPVGCVHRFRFGPAAVDGINDFQMFSPTCGIGDFKMQGFHGMVCLRSCSPRGTQYILYGYIIRMGMFAYRGNSPKWR